MTKMARSFDGRIIKLTSRSLTVRRELPIDLLDMIAFSGFHSSVAAEKNPDSQDPNLRMGAETEAEITESS